MVVPRPPATPVGGEVCAGCHEREAAAWRGSDHDLALQEPSESTVLGDFDDASFSEAGLTTQFRRSEGAFVVRAPGRDGAPRDFPVRYVIGARPLQQVLLDIGGGRLQAYPVAWDVRRRRWFSLYPGQGLSPEDPLHWTRFLLNWNQGCADCHSTNLHRGYDPATDNFDTTWSDIDVSCEACHGPGSRHVAWARGGAAPAPARGLLVSLDAGPLPGRGRARQLAEIDVCAPCHARRAPVHPPDRWDAPLTEGWRPELLREGLYHPDGQIREEVYVYGSFAQSRMYAEGVVCTDCHDPHDLGLEAEGNALCTRCHEPARFDTSAHTHHVAGTAGSACVDCHMAETRFMQVDPRRDHGFHLPRPDLTLDLGVPNACNRCHTRETPAWARDRVVAWFGPKRPEDVHEARVIAAGRAGVPGAAGALAALVRNPARAAILRATAVDLLRTCDAGAARRAVREALTDPDPLVRATAAAAAADLARRVTDLEPLVPLLRDPSRLVRMETAAALAPAARQLLSDPGAAEARAWRAALEEYRRGQLGSAEQPMAHLNLGVLAEALGDPLAARRAYHRALRIEPDFVPARFNLAMLDALSGRPAAAEAGFRAVMRLAPGQPEARVALGLLLAGDPQRLEESAALLLEAARAAPGRARYQYHAGLAALRLGRLVEAASLLGAAVRLEPRMEEYRRALAAVRARLERPGEAPAGLEGPAGRGGGAPGRAAALPGADGERTGRREAGGPAS